MNPAISSPIEKSYVNLSIVDIKEQREKEKQLRDAQHAATIMNTYEQIYGVKTPIDVKDIFRTCKNQEKQVLVFGRAGIGKSTFCRYVAYQWATGSYWPHYELLALIPLRRLTFYYYPPDKNYSLIDLVIKELFPLGLTKNEEEVFNKDFDAKKTLWILDGYDEIVPNVPPHLKCLLEQLLKTPHHIITSRPYLNTLAYNVQMEITGFTDENIQNYVQKFFSQMEDELDATTTSDEKLLSYLRSNSSIWGVAHIPLLLELICSVWSNQDLPSTEQLTMTRLYTEMTDWVCRRYLRTQDNHIPQLSQHNIDECCQKELTFLENLAFRAMQSNTIIIRPALLEKAWKETKIPSQQNPHILNMGILKSFHKQGTGNFIEMKKDHYFVHLSFQEYFAARYLINALEGSQREQAIEFIKYQKYNQRYTLLFSFASGLLSDNDGKAGLDLFWNTLLGEPLDLVGIRHMQLVIACMEETASKSTLPRGSELLVWIGKCVHHSVTTTENETMCKHLFQSLKRAQSVTCHSTIMDVFIDLIQHHNEAKRGQVLSFIAELKISSPSSALISVIVSRLNHQDHQIRGEACFALGKIGEKAATNEVITKLVSALGDESKYVRGIACLALSEMGEKAATNEVVTKLASALGDDSDWVKNKARDALSDMGEKSATNEVITKLVSALGDESEGVRRYACDALGEMGEKAATNEVITKLVSTLGDESEWVRNSACSALVKMGEKAATNKVISKLVSALGDESDWVRDNACLVLGKMGEKAATNEVITKLTTALGDESEGVRNSACDALGEMGEKAVTNEVITKLASALGDESEGVRKYACSALVKMGEETATNKVITKLVSALGNESDSVRSYACLALGEMGEKAATNEVITKLASALGDESEGVRKYACSALVKMGEETATNAVIIKLVSALGDESDSMRSYACLALGEMGEKSATNEVITKLASALGDESEDVRKYACLVLGEMGEKSATNEVITKLASALGDESEDVRKYACFALGKMGEKAATNEVITKLVSALGDESEGVRRYACDALVKMGEKAATNEVITKLVTALGDESEDVRSGVCEVLREMGEKAATNEVITKLVSTLGDESEDIRRNACLALEKMGKKAATNEAIGKLVSIVTSGTHWSYIATQTLGAICNGSVFVKELGPTLITNICLDNRVFIYFKNIAVDDLLNIFVNTKNSDWLPAVIRLSIVKGTAVTVIEDKVVVFNEKEPTQLLISDPQLRQQLIEGFIHQAKELHLDF